MDLRVIGISGFARSGKDTLALYLLNKYEGLFEKFALADELKLDLNNFLKQKTSISAFTIDSIEKTLIRDLLVAYGKIKRHQTQGRYWTQLLQPKIDHSIKNGRIPLITDIRYDEFPEDEVFWVQNLNKGQLIHITRIEPNSTPIEAPNRDEALNDPRIKSKANFYLQWTTFLNKDKEREPVVQNQLSGLIIEIEKRHNEFKRRE